MKRNILLAFLFIFSLVTCATIQGILGTETPEKTALRFTKTWNTEYDRTFKIVFSHLQPAQQDLLIQQIKDVSLSDDFKKDLIAKNTNPTLTKEQKELVNIRKSILTTSKPLISLYTKTVLAGGTPSALDEKEIEKLLESLLTKFIK